ncbi:hypothetical protein [Pseudomonas palmensis]
MRAGGLLLADDRARCISQIAFAGLLALRASSRGKARSYALRAEAPAL